MKNQSLTLWRCSSSNKSETLLEGACFSNLSCFSCPIGKHLNAWIVLVVGSPYLWQRRKKGWWSLIGQQIDRGKIKLKDEFSLTGGELMQDRIRRSECLVIFILMLL